ncbi:MAG: MFS transporter [Deltaproteobacteria bacterium]|nr:MFS transporter [Deltaproteobacteria bacterium]
MDEAPLSLVDRRRNLIAVTAAMTATSLIYGLSVPLLSLILQDRGISGTLIGTQAAVQSVAILLISPFLPRYMSKIGPAILMLASILVSLVAFLLLPFFPSMLAWFVLRFTIGAAGAVLWVCGEAWINQIAEDSTRGRVVAIYSMAVSAGFALGPAVLSMTGSDGFAPFIVSGAVMLLSALPLLMVLHNAPCLAGERSGTLPGYFRLAPVAMLLCALFAAADGMLISFLPLYGKDVGLSEGQALYLIVLFGIGGIVGQIQIGWLADRVDRMLLATICTFLIVLTSLVMPFVISIQPWNLLYMLVLGAVLSGVYTIALVIIGQQFKGADLAAASALFGVMWGAGTVLGPQLGGLAYDFFPPHGIPLSLAVLTAMLLPFPMTAWLRRRAGR